MSEKAKPILFSGPMVRAILEGRKSQTRRIMKPQPEFTGATGDSWEWHGGKALERAGYGAPYVHTSREAMVRAMLVIAPKKPGDMLWVRETFRLRAGQDSSPPSKDWWKSGAWYEADGNCEPSGCAGGAGKKRPAIFMPRWASRITLKVTGVRVERLQDISEEDAKAEGCECPEFRTVVMRPDGGKDYHIPSSFRGAYANLWTTINGPSSWDANPWVWVYEFERQP